MSNWIDVASEADLFEGAGIAVTPLNFDIAIFKVDDGVFAINNECWSVKVLAVLQRKHRKVMSGWSPETLSLLPL